MWVNKSGGKLNRECLNIYATVTGHALVSSPTDLKRGRTAWCHCYPSGQHSAVVWVSLQCRSLSRQVFLSLLFPLHGMIPFPLILLFPEPVNVCDRPSLSEVEPMIEKGHENLVHHILLYQCDRNVNASESDPGHECHHPNMPDSFLTCETVIFAWAIGGEVCGLCRLFTGSACWLSWDVNGYVWK